MVDGRYLVVLDEVEAEAPVRVTFMAHTPGRIDLEEGGAKIQGVRTHLRLSLSSPRAVLTTPPSPLGYRRRLADRVLHATAPPARRVALATVVWPEKEDDDAPRCAWERPELTVYRPDGGVDRLSFVTSGDGLRFQGVSTP